MSNKNTWPDEVRLKMIEKSEWYTEPRIYQWGYYDGYQEAIQHTAALRQEVERLQSHLAKYREAMDRIVVEAEDTEQVDWLYVSENMVSIAKEALKQEGEA